MAVFRFSALSDGQAISFNPNADVLNFDQLNVAAADLALRQEGSNLRVVVQFGPQAGKDIVLLNTTTQQVATTNMTFADGSRVLFGDNSAATVNDNAGNVLTGGNGRDLINGFGGPDTIAGGLGDDRIVAGAGDVLSDAGGVDTVLAEVDWTLSDQFENLEIIGSGNLSATGNNGANLLVGNAGNNFFNPRGGNDTIQGGDGNDFVRLGGGGVATYGSKVINLGTGFDGLDFGGLAKSAITVDLAAGTLSGGGEGGTGNAILSGIEQVIGDGFNDRLLGSFSADSLNGGGGNDTLNGRGGNDTLTGGLGQDTFEFASRGPTQASQVTDFASGTDKLAFNNAAFRELGAAGGFVAGDARFVAGAGLTSGQDASDRVIYNTTTGQLFYDPDGNGPGQSLIVATLQGRPAVVATDVVVTEGAAPNIITGTAGNDSLLGTGGIDSISGLAGNDTIDGRTGDDTVRGGDGDDTLIDHVNGGPDAAVQLLDGGLGNDTYDLLAFPFDARPAVVIVDAGGIDTILTNHSFTQGLPLPDGIENLTLFEAFFGTGNALDNVITTRSDEDHAHVVDGAAGNDTLIGDVDSSDSMTGGAGNDVFVFSQAPLFRFDQLEDFTSGTDRLQFDNAGFPAVGGAGAFTPGDARFASGAGLTSGQDASDRLIYDTTNGDLYYDPDGNGAAASVRVAHLTGAPTLAATDIVVTGQSASSTIQGTEGNDTLTGTPVNDTIDGRGGNDLLNGLDGADLLIGGAGDDTLDGGAGSNTLDGGLGNDTYLVTHAVSSPDDVLVDAGGIDTIIVNGNSHGGVLPDGFENMTVRGTPPFAGFDPGMGGNAADNVLRNESNAAVMAFVGAGGNDTLNGGNNADDFFFDGAYGNDVVDGGGGSDTLFVGGSSAVVMGVGTVSGGGTAGSGSVTFSNIEAVQASVFDDLLRASDAGMTLRGGSGNDTLVGGAGNDVLWDDFVPEDNPQFEEIGNDSVSGGAGDDGILIARGNDTAQGGAGNDVITIDSQLFSAGADSIDGGDGIDTVETSAGTNVVADLAAGTVNSADGSHATLVGVENFSAAHFVGAGPQGPVADISGSSGANVLIGNQGGDTLNGRAGNDTLTGGGGADHFIFDQAPGAANADRITDFASGADKLHLDARVMTALGASGNFAAGDARFFAAAGATGGHDADDRVVYNTSTGQLFYDADGNGAGAGQLIATLQTGAALTATDIVVDNGTAPSGQFIQGTAGNDSLTGTPGDDTLDGGAGLDTMNGGLGNDTYIVTAGDQLVDAGGVDTVLSGIDWTLVDGIENLTLTGTANVSATGNNGVNVLTGNAGNNFFNPRGGDDTIQGGAGNDFVRLGGGGVPSYGNKVIDLGAGFDGLDFGGLAKSAITVDLAAGTLTGGGDAGQGSASLIGVEQVIGDGFNDRLSGSAAAESLDGGTGNDTLDGRGGNDTLAGGLGSDIFGFSTAPVAGNADQVVGFASAADKLNFDNSVFTALGTAGNFTAGDARFAAGAGFTSGRDASDRLVYNTTTGQLFYDADGNGAGAAQLVATLQGAPALAATDIVVTGQAQPNPGQPTAGNDSLTGTDGNDSINGLAGNDTINALAGNDTIDGGPGADSMVGGLGDDLYLVDDPGDMAIEQAGGLNGIDTVNASVSHTLGAFVNNLTLVGTAAINGTGNEIDNVIIGNAAPNALSGGAGNDRLDAGTDSDTLNGGAGNDTLTGGGGADHFIFDQVAGGANADRITDFASGADKLHLDARVMTALGASGSFTAGDARFFAAAGATGGHDADDRVVYNTSTGQLFYDADGNGAGAGQLIATLQTGAALTATDIVVDNGTAPSGQFIQGTAGNDSLTGTPGDDTLDGGAGIDTMNGGLGNDTYIVTAGDQLVDAGGVDTVLSSIDWTLVDGIENLTLTGTANVSATGNNGVNVLTGNAGNNFFNPRGGNDTIQGGDGNDFVRLGGGGVPSYGNKVIDLGAGFDGLDFGGLAKSAITVDLAAGTLTGGGDAGQGSASLIGVEQVIGDGFNDRLSGGFAPAEALNGGGGNDTISGRAGNDTLTGGAGQDTFVFTSSSNGGQIADFVSATDKLSFDGVAFSDLGAPGNFVAGDERFFSGAGATSAHDASDRLIYNTTTGQLFYDPDGSNLFNPLLIVTLQGAPALAATDIAVFPGFVNGTAGNDSLIGTEGDDRLSGLDGNDTIDGLGGIDGLIGGSGDDSLNGGGGDDYVEGDDGADLLLGGDGNDELAGMDGADTLLGGAGNDWLHGDFSGPNVLDGGAGDDFLEQGSALDSMEGGLGNDTFRIFSEGAITDAGGIDTILVHASSNWTLAPGWENLGYFITFGDDHGVHGGLAVGNELDNVIDVTAADGASLDGRAGNDTLIGSGFPDVYYFTVSPGAANADLIPGFRPDSDLIVIDEAAHPDLGAEGRFVAGDERFFAGAGATSGHDASDRVAYNTSTGELFYDADGSGAGAAQLIATLEGAPTLIASDIGVTAVGGPNVIFGTPLWETFFGTSGSDLIDARGGDDDLSGGDGSDTLIGGSGVDQLTGGIGSDSFVFAAAPGTGNFDFVTDFVSATDKLAFDDTVFTALGGAGNFAVGDARFAAGAGFTSGRDASDRIIYDTTTGSLYYDADGSGAGAAELVAALQSGSALAATDITVI